MKISYPVFKSLLALSLGTLGVCMSEFSIMAILPEVARSLSVSIPEAGHFISAYALGVCVGAPLTVLVARRDHSFVKLTLRELMPHGFGPKGME